VQVETTLNDILPADLDMADEFGLNAQGQSSCCQAPNNLTLVQEKPQNIICIDIDINILILI